MSREIKFRAWDKDTQCYFYDVAVYPNNVVGIQRHNIESEILKAEYGATHWTELGENAVIEQYTGLKDKNGKEIYEGDIVRVKEYDGYVELTKVGYVIYDTDATFSMKIPSEDINRFLRWDCEVIGNIHENPELLETKNER